MTRFAPLLLLALACACTKSVALRYEPGATTAEAGAAKLFLANVSDKAESVRVEPAGGGFGVSLATPFEQSFRDGLSKELARQGMLSATVQQAQGVLSVAVEQALLRWGSGTSSLYEASIRLTAVVRSSDRRSVIWSGEVTGQGKVAGVGGMYAGAKPERSLNMAFNDAISRLAAALRAEALGGVASAGEPGAPRAPAPALAAAPRSDVDELPAAAAPRRAHAVVIGIERYRESLPAADFAAGDARLTAEYFKRLGVPEENVALLVDDRATRGDFEKYFERWLPNRVGEGDEVFVYYSGHGAPNPAKGDAYLLPYDGDPGYVEQTGYPLAKLYAQLAKLPAKRVVVAMDSCFSGAGGRSVIAKGARPLVSVAAADVPAKVIVLSASAGDQISNSYQEKGHGLFTYFLLKGLKQRGADFKAAFDYLKPEVARVARREYNADQDPQWREGR